MASPEFSKRLARVEKTAGKRFRAVGHNFLSNYTAAENHVELIVDLIIINFAVISCKIFLNSSHVDIPFGQIHVKLRSLF